jgi:hypothetical protein
MQAKQVRGGARFFGLIANRRVRLVSGLAVIVSASACEQPAQPAATTAQLSLTPHYTTSTSSSTLIGRGAFSEDIKLKRTNGAWKFKLDSDPMDVAMQTIVFQPGQQSGWHMHPGPVFILVTAGQITFYESDDPSCTPIVRSAGQGYLDVGDHAHLARNETQVEARTAVTYLAPPGATLRIDAPAPGNCAF